MRPLRSKPIERLVDADPAFYDYTPDRALNPNAGPDRKGLGVIFMCPIHEECWVSVPFKVALDGGAPVDPARVAWDRAGDTFEGLTLSPSIRILGGPNGCEWHGFIKAGRFETCGDSR